MSRQEERTVDFAFAKYTVHWRNCRERIWNRSKLGLDHHTPLQLWVCVFVAWNFAVESVIRDVFVTDHKFFSKIASPELSGGQVPEVWTGWQGAVCGAQTVPNGQWIVSPVGTGPQHVLSGKVWKQVWYPFFIKLMSILDILPQELDHNNLANNFWMSSNSCTVQCCWTHYPVHIAWRCWNTCRTQSWCPCPENMWNPMNCMYLSHKDIRMPLIWLVLALKMRNVRWVGNY